MLFDKILCKLKALYISITKRHCLLDLMVYPTHPSLFVPLSPLESMTGVDISCDTAAAIYNSVLLTHFTLELTGLQTHRQRHYSAHTATAGATRLASGVVRINICIEH